MPLDEDSVIEWTKLLLQQRSADSYRLDRIHEYLTDEQRLEWLPRRIPEEVRRIARASRVNMLKFVVRAAVQSMYVDGFRAPRQADDVEAWDIWQRNRMDARQIGIHRAGISYGVSYATVLPGDPVPVMRGASPRNMTVLYGSDDDWPRFALEKRRNGVWRLFDAEAVYSLEIDDNDPVETIRLVDVEEHGAGVTPVIRFRETDDLDDEVIGVVEPLLPLQDQINITTFGLLVAQHYGAFRQRYILGWLAESEEQKFQASASRLWTFEDSPDDVKIGEFGQTDLKGYLDSREASLRHLSTVSQTPAHELLGQLVNLSAEALAAAEASHRRAITEYQTVMGESHEQALGLGGELMGSEPDPLAYVRWKDTEARSMVQMADALGKLVQMLGVPPQELWERIPGVSQQEIDRWKAAAEVASERDPLAQLARQMPGNGSAPELTGAAE